MSSYKTTCPECSGHNFYTTPANGMQYCFNCGHTAFADGVVRKEPTRYHDITAIRQLYTELTYYYHSSLTTEVRDYLYSRGITDQDIQELQLGYCPNSYTPLYDNEHAIAAGLVNKIGKVHLAGRIIFPYWNSTYVTDLRGRSLDPDAEIRYLSPFNGAFHRGADYPFLWREENKIVVEGEIKALRVKQLGYNVCGIPGINAIRPKTTFYIICFDSDENPVYVQRAILKIGKYRRERLKIATIPREGFKKMGADDYIDQYGADAFKRVIDAALPFETWKRIML